MAEEIIEATTAEQTAPTEAETPAETAAESTTPDYTAEIERLKAENEKLKQAQSKASADASRYKKDLQARMSEQEKAEQERAERERAREARIAELEAKERVSDYQRRLMDTGYDNDTAYAMAEALPEGVGDDFFDKQKAFLDNFRKTLEAQALNKQPGLTPGTPPTSQNNAETDKLRKWMFGG